MVEPRAPPAPSPLRGREAEAGCRQGPRQRHSVQAQRRIKLFALKFITGFYFQNNKAPKEAEAVLLT